MINIRDERFAELTKNFTEKDFVNAQNGIDNGELTIGICPNCGKEYFVELGCWLCGYDPEDAREE